MQGFIVDLEGNQHIKFAWALERATNNESKAPTALVGLEFLHELNQGVVFVLEESAIIICAFRF